MSNSGSTRHRRQHGKGPLSGLLSSIGLGRKQMGSGAFSDMLSLIGLGSNPNAKAETDGEITFLAKQQL